MEFTGLLDVVIRSILESPITTTVDVHVGEGQVLLSVTLYVVLCGPDAVFVCACLGVSAVGDCRVGCVGCIPECVGDVGVVDGVGSRAYCGHGCGGEMMLIGGWEVEAKGGLACTVCVL